MKAHGDTPKQFAVETENGKLYWSRVLYTKVYSAGHIMQAEMGTNQIRVSKGVYVEILFLDSSVNFPESPLRCV